MLVHIHCTVELVQLEKHGFWDADEQRKTLRAAVIDSIECLEAVMHRAKAEMQATVNDGRGLDLNCPHQQLLDEL